MQGVPPSDERADSAFGIGAKLSADRPQKSTVLSGLLADWASLHSAAPRGLFVLRLEPGGPAALSGQVREGDEVLAVDRHKVEGLTPDDVDKLVCGKQGSLVRLRLKRNSAIFNVCLQREAVLQGLPERKVRTPSPMPPRSYGASDVLEKLYASFAKINRARAAQQPEKMSPGELKAFHAAQEAQVKQNENIAKRCFDASKRRGAEIGVLRRELQVLEKQDAPFARILEYRNLIRRLEIEEELGPLHLAHLDAEELEAEELELLERERYLKMTLRVLEDASGAADALPVRPPSSHRILKAESCASPDHLLPVATGREAARAPELVTEGGADRREHRESGPAGPDGCGLVAEDEVCSKEAGNVEDGLACNDGDVQVQSNQVACVTADGGEHSLANGHDGDAGSLLVMVNGRQRLKTPERSDVDILRSKLRQVQEQLALLRGVPNRERDAPTQDLCPRDAARARGLAPHSVCGMPPKPGEGEMSAEGEERRSDQQAGRYVTNVLLEGKGGNAGELEVGCGKGGRIVGGWRGSGSAVAGLAAEVGNKWVATGAEPREGARFAAEGTLEDAPEPCMLAQSTIQTAQRLWKFG